MDGVLFLIVLGIVMGLAGLAAFLWSLRSGQYDDLKGAAERILYEQENKSDREPPPLIDHSESNQGERVQERTRRDNGSNAPH